MMSSFIDLCWPIYIKKGIHMEQEKNVNVTPNETNISDGCTKNGKF